MKARHSKLLILFFLTFSLSTLLIYIWHISQSLPEELYIYSNKDTVVDLDIPVTAVIKETNQTVDFSKPVTFQAKEKADYSLEYKLFNLISMPSGKLSVLEENSLYTAVFLSAYTLRLTAYSWLILLNLSMKTGRHALRAEIIL